MWQKHSHLVWLDKRSSLLSDTASGEQKYESIVTISSKLLMEVRE